MASPSALTLPAAAPARHFPISRRGRRVPRRQHPTGPLGGRDVRPCAGARSAARSGRASIVARDGPGLTISTVMDVLKRLVVNERPQRLCPLIPCGLYAGLPAHAIMYGLDRNYVPHTRRDAHVSEDRHALAGLTPAVAPCAPSILPIFTFTHIKESRHARQARKDHQGL